MGKYYQVLKRINLDVPQGPDGQLHKPRHEGARATKSLMPVAALQELPRGVLQAQMLQSISERLAPLAIVDQSSRIVVAGCERGDGTSTIAAALALDLSQRLALHVLLVDAHLRSPRLHTWFAHASSANEPLLLDGNLQIQSTGFRGLDLATCSVHPGALSAASLLTDLEQRAARYQVAVIDLGVARLDPRLLALAGTDDPILLVVRYRQTQRRSLATTVSALRAANRSIAGVILNDRIDPFNTFVRRFIPA